MHDQQPPNRNKTKQIIVKLSPTESSEREGLPPFKIAPYWQQEGYHDDLVIIVREGYYAPVFIDLDVLLIEYGSQQQQAHLQAWYERHVAYIAIHSPKNQRTGEYETRWTEGLAPHIARSLYIAYHLEYVCGEEGFHREQYRTLAAKLNIDPVLAHMLVRMMCSLSLTYGKDASYYYQRYLYETYNAWNKKREKDKQDKEREDNDEEADDRAARHYIATNFIDYGCEDEEYEEETTYREM